MSQMVVYFIDLMPSFFYTLDNLFFVPGVSLLGVLLALFIIFLFLNNFLFRAR